MYKATPIAALLAISVIAAVMEAADPGPPSPSPFLRLAIVDKSGSMTADRLNVARTELVRLARQLPPSPSHPFVVIPFDSSVRNVRTFTDLPAMEQFMSSLTAGGGTNIAVGLGQAVDQLKRYPDTPNVCILLYTDGEDGMQDQIAAQEAKLDALFADRQTRGFDQTVVFCKRWQGAGAQLVQQLADRGHARIIDAAELNLVPVTLDPQIGVADVRWLDDKPMTLEIDLDALIAAHGQDSPYNGPPLLLECVTPQADGDIRVPITPADPASAALTIRLPIQPKTALVGGHVQLQFKLGEPQPTYGDESVILPMLTLDRITVPIKIPPTKFRTLVTASIEQIDPGTWTDAIRLQPAFPLRLTLDVSTVDNAAWTCPVPFRLTPQKGTKILDGKDTLLLHGPGKYELALRASGTPTSKPADGRLPEFRVAFRVHPETTPPNVRFEPAEVDFEQSFPAPPPIVTNISARIVAVSQPRWADLRHAISTFDADLAVSVDGPIWPGAKLTVRCPPPVRDLQITPAVLHQGSQMIRLQVLAILPSAPTEDELIFRIVPPAQQGAVRLHADKPFSCSLTSPSPLRLAFSDGSRIPRCFRTIHRKTTHPVQLSVTPILVGLDDPAATEGLGGSIRSSGPLAASTATALPLYRRSNVQITLPPQMKRSFFRDTRIHGEISILPSPESPALVGSTHSIQSTLEAPFKRLLCHLALAVCSLLALFLIARMFLRLRTPAEK